LVPISWLKSTRRTTNWRSFGYNLCCRSRGFGDIMSERSEELTAFYLDTRSILLVALVDTKQRLRLRTLKRH
jgi:hypothetical protein